MSLVNWFKRATAPPSSPRLEGLIESVVAYLKTRPPDEEIRPHIVGRAISENELAAMTALSILERQGITKHHFGVYCGDKGVPIGSYDDLADVPPFSYCDACGIEHCSSDKTCRVEIYFTVDRDKLASFRKEASAA